MDLCAKKSKFTKKAHHQKKVLSEEEVLKREWKKSLRKKKLYSSPEINKIANKETNRPLRRSTKRTLKAQWSELYLDEDLTLLTDQDVQIFPQK